MQIRCKCHGMSGSCQLKTCWKSAPDFRIVGKVLKHMFRNAVLVDQSNMGNGEPIIQPNLSGRRRLPRKTMNQHRSKIALENTLFYYQRSPTFCERDPSADIQGEDEFYVWFTGIFHLMGEQLQELLAENVTERAQAPGVAHPCAAVVAITWRRSIASKNVTVNFCGAAMSSASYVIQMSGLVCANRFVSF